MDDTRRVEPDQGIATFIRKYLAAVLGSGIVAMLADTDAGSFVTASQSGAQWGYRLLWLRLVLIPMLFMTQELTVRLGAVTGVTVALGLYAGVAGLWS